MPISIVYWRVEIGVFNSRSFMRVAKCIFSVNVRTTLAKYLFMLLCGITLLLICGDVELNLGPKKTKSCYNFSLYCWNLNSVTAHNFSIISLLEAYNVQHKFDMICISETYLDSSFPNDDPILNLPGYNVVRTDNPNNVKRGGVCVYFKESLSVGSVTSLYINECLLLEVFIQNKKSYVVSLYRSPSQAQDQFNEFLRKFEQLLCDIISCNSSFLLIAGDFNGRTSSWWRKDSATSEGTQIVKHLPVLMG